MRLWVLEFGRVTKRERDGEVERWRPAVTRRLWVEAGSSMIMGIGLWISVGGFVRGGQDGGWWLADQRC